jgi:hypothetical protein
VKDFFSVNPREDLEADKIRDRNIDRLKLLQQYEQNKHYADPNLTYLKYSEGHEDELQNRL